MIKELSDDQFFKDNLTSGANNWIIKQLKNMPIIKFPRNVKPEKFKHEDASLPCPFEPEFWNQADHVQKTTATICY